MTQPQNWCDVVRTIEPVLIEAVQAADALLPPVFRAHMNKSLVKQNLSHFLRNALRSSGLPIAPLSSGNADVEYLVWKGVAVVRVKGLNARGLPSNYPTDTAVNYHLGNDVDAIGLPPLPRVDFSYRLSEPLFTLRAIELLEWRDGVAVKRFQLPMYGMPREVEEAGVLPFTVAPTEIRPSREETARRRKTREQGDSQ